MPPFAVMIPPDTVPTVQFRITKPSTSLKRTKEDVRVAPGAKGVPAWVRRDRLSTSLMMLSKKILPPPNVPARRVPTDLGTAAEESPIGALWVISPIASRVTLVADSIPFAVPPL